MRHSRDDRGASAVVGFIIAIVLFTVSFYYVVDSSVQREADTTTAETANFSLIASNVAGQIMGKGVGWYPADPCVASPTMGADAVGALDGQGEPLGRFGLGDEGCSFSVADPRRANNLSYAKFSNINSAKMDATAGNGFVDYEEARRSLELDDDLLDFHIRSEPVLASVRSILGTGYKDPFLKPLYLGNYVPGASSPARPAITAVGSFRTDSQFGYLDVTITNTGEVASGFSVDYTIQLKKKPIAFTVNSFTLNPGDPDPQATVTGMLRKTSDWDWGANTAEFSFAVSDSIGQLAEGTASMAALPMNDVAAPAQPIVALSMDRRSYGEPFSASNKWPSAKYVAYEGDGDAIPQFDENDADLRIIKDPGAAESVIATIADPSPTESLKEELDASPADGYTDAGTGRYRADLMVPNVAGSKVTEAFFEISSGSECNVSPGNYVPAQSVVDEATYVETLFSSFQKGVVATNYDHALMPYVAGATTELRGDVFPDVKCSMNTDLPSFLLDDAGQPTLARYTTLIVGSDVDHNAMTSDAAKGTIRDWVYAGGTLIVFGSDAQSVQWLQPIFHGALQSASGGLYTPDADHPALTVPNELDYSAFISSERWTYNSGAEGSFTHVVTEGQKDALAISNSGAFQGGKVILSSWRPYALVDPAQQAATCTPVATAQCQGLALIHNLIVISYRNLYLDYGPPIPLYAPNGVQTRVASVYHPDLQQLITIYLQIYVFNGS